MGKISFRRLYTFATYIMKNACVRQTRIHTKKKIIRLEVNLNLKTHFSSLSIFRLPYDLQYALNRNEGVHDDDKIYIVFDINFVLKKAKQAKVGKKRFSHFLIMTMNCFSSLLRTQSWTLLK